MPKPKTEKANRPSVINAGRIVGIGAGSWIVGAVSVVLQPVLWLIGVVLGFLQVAALCGAVVLFVHWLVGRVQR